MFDSEERQFYTRQAMQGAGEVFSQLSAESYTVVQSEVVEFFVQRAIGVPLRVLEQVDPSWLPFALSSFAHRPFFSVPSELPIVFECEDVNFCPDSDNPPNTYRWIDLSEVRTGTLVGRISCRGTVHVFRKEGARAWRYLCVEGLPRFPDNMGMDGLAVMEEAFWEEVDRLTVVLMGLEQMERDETERLKALVSAAEQVLFSK